jgi:4-amino-4-deoxy-L-arabinose transferase-like glycosyltransferase
VGVVCFLLGFVPVLSGNSSGRKMWQMAPTAAVDDIRQVVDVWRRLIHCCRSRRVELVGLALLLLSALFVRGVNLEHIPANLGGDEGTWGMEGLAMFADGRMANPFTTRWLAFPSLSFLASGLSMCVFGETVTGLRAFSALAGTATVLTTFLLARELWGRRVGWWAAVALAFGHFHIHFSRLAVNNIGDGLFITLALWLLVRGLRSRRAIHFALAGAVAGLGWYGYFGARLIGVLVALYVAWRAVVEYRFLARYGRLLLILLGAALVVASPLLLHYAVNPDALLSRSRQVSLFASGWLAREQATTGRSIGSLLLQQFWRSISAFHYTLDPTFWYRPSIPLLDCVSGVLFILGILWATGHWRWPANGLLLMWFWLALIFGWVLTENPPSSMRLVIMSPALALLVGLGLNWLLDLLKHLRFPHPAFRTWSVVTLLVIIAILNLHYYFIVYTPMRIYGNPTAEVTTELGRALARREDRADTKRPADRGLPADSGHPCVVYFYGPPFIYWDFGTLRFLARGVEGMDVPPPGEGESPVPDRGKGACFVFLRERMDELAQVRARYPGGVETFTHSSVDGRPLYVSYEIGPVAMNNEQ